MMNAASITAALRVARIHSTRRPLQHQTGTLGRSFASAQTQTSVEPPVQKYSENEFPDRQEPPVITRTNAADLTASATTKPKSREQQYTISSARCIGTERPAHIPPNVPLDKLEIPETKITTLSNGVRVGSIETYSQVSSVGVLMDFGSRHELDKCTIPSTDTTVSTAGVNHMMELLAFQSTKNHSGAEIRNIMENLGGASFATSSREQMMYCVDVLRPNVAKAFDLMGETIKCPLIEDAEVEEMKQVIQFQLMDMMPQLSMGSSDLD